MGTDLLWTDFRKERQTETDTVPWWPSASWELSEEIERKPPKSCRPVTPISLSDSQDLVYAFADASSSASARAGLPTQKCVRTKSQGSLCLHPGVRISGCFLRRFPDIYVNLK